MARKGPKLKGEFPGQTAVFSTRVRPELRAKLDEEAARTGVPLSQIVEWRLRWSYREDDKRAEAFGDGPTYGMFRAMAAIVFAVWGFRKGYAKGAEEHVEAHWTRDPAAYDQAVRAINEFLERLRPSGPIPEPPEGWVDHPTANLGRGQTSVLLADIRDADPLLPLDERSEAKLLALNLRKDIGHLVDRAEIPLPPTPKQSKPEGKK